jgi:hypothetical protein
LSVGNVAKKQIFHLSFDIDHLSLPAKHRYAVQPKFSGTLTEHHPVLLPLKMTNDQCQMINGKSALFFTPFGSRKVTGRNACPTRI